MAVKAYKITLGQSLGEGRYSTSSSNAGATVSASTALITAVQDAMTTLQADGASPTEAHVDTADTAWIALSAALTLLNTTLTGNIVILVDDAVITNTNAVRAALKEAQALIAASGGLAVA